MNKPFVIAEIGINHNGNMAVAKELIDMAKDCGCDAVKFQKRDIYTVYTEDFLQSHRESPWGTTQLEQKLGLEFGQDEYDQIDAYCKEKGIDWFASAWDEKSFHFLKQYDLKYNKIASPMLTNYDFVTRVAGEGKYTFISTGMSTKEDIDKVVTCFKRAGTPFTLMHCVSVYPCSDEYLNVRMVKILKGIYNCPVGYSNHSPGILSSILAVVMGAEAIEAHITLDRSMYGSDQAASIERRGLDMLVRECRLVKKVLGTGERIMLPEELKNAEKLRYWEAHG